MENMTEKNSVLEKKEQEIQNKESEIRTYIEKLKDSKDATADIEVRKAELETEKATLRLVISELTEEKGKELKSAQEDFDKATKDLKKKKGKLFNTLIENGDKLGEMVNRLDGGQIDKEEKEIKAKIKAINSSILEIEENLLSEKDKLEEALNSTSDAKEMELLRGVLWERRNEFLLMEEKKQSERKLYESDLKILHHERKLATKIKAAVAVEELKEDHENMLLDEYEEMKTKRDILKFEAKIEKSKKRQAQISKGLEATKLGGALGFGKALFAVLKITLLFKLIILFPFALVFGLFKNKKDDKSKNLKDEQLEEIKEMEKTIKEIKKSKSLPKEIKESVKDKLAVVEKHLKNAKKAKTDLGREQSLLVASSEYSFIIHDHKTEFKSAGIEIKKSENKKSEEVKDKKEDEKEVVKTPPKEREVPDYIKKIEARYTEKLADIEKKKQEHQYESISTSKKE